MGFFRLSKGGQVVREYTYKNERTAENMARVEQMHNDVMHEARELSHKDMNNVYEVTTHHNDGTPTKGTPRSFLLGDETTVAPNGYMGGQTYEEYHRARGDWQEPKPMGMWT